ncbi:cap methyltransferase 2 isoform X2 [Leptinotarsa decemlineata]|uniref:cap methyltransferase 2 isoform X2 n=1 Tax=Leptinotarsa decemlineata TaxID=7539 RepID=UPI003D30D25E
MYSEMAWCKFYEILSQFPVVPLCAISQHKLVSLHLCEAPGAFVCALNHYLTLNYPGLEWSWKASTLNPNYEGNSLSQMIPDDRFIKHTISKWNFGADFSGDITKFYNHEDFVLFFRKNNIKVSLVTADGSVDCMNNPGEQERQVERLHFCETMTALSVLQKGGAFVLKIFTIFEDTTINLLFLLNCLFEKVSVFKPCCSKGGNSEVYVVSTNFKGSICLQNLWHKFSVVYRDENLFSSHSMFFQNEIPHHFLEEILTCADLFMKKQIMTILDNIHHFENRTRENLHFTKSFIANMYMKKYELKPIPDDNKIVPNVNVLEDWSVNSARKKKGFIKLNLESYSGHSNLSNIFHMVTGKQISTVQNTRFTYADDLKNLSKIVHRTSERSELYQTILKVIGDENIVINYKDFHSLPFHEFHRRFFQRVYCSLNQDKNLIFLNIPLVTHFIVGLFYILFFMFDEVYFGNCIIVLKGPKLEAKEKILDIFFSIKCKYEMLAKNNVKSEFVSDILQVVTPSSFCVSLMNNIWNYNRRLFCLDQLFLRKFSHTKLNT